MNTQVTMDLHFNCLYGRLNNIKRLIGMHIVIAESIKTLSIAEQYNNCLGFLQNIFLSNIILDLNVLLDVSNSNRNNDDITINRLLDFIKQEDKKNIEKEKLFKLNQKTKHTKIIRNKAIAHSTTTTFDPRVDYVKILEILPEIKKLLDDLWEEIKKNKMIHFEDFHDFDPTLKEFKKFMELATGNTLNIQFSELGQA